MSTYIALAQFQKLVGLSDAALCHLLRQNQLPCQFDPERGILIDVSHASVEQMVRTIAERTAEPSPRYAEILEERLGQVIAEKLQEIKEQAIRIVLEGPAQK